jgi:hypothetical protein
MLDFYRVAFRKKILSAAVGEHAAEPGVMLVEERHDAVIQQIGRGNQCLAIVELGERHLGIGVDEVLFVDASDTL